LQGVSDGSPVLKSQSLISLYIARTSGESSLPIEAGSVTLLHEATFGSEKHPNVGYPNETEHVARDTPDLLPFHHVLPQG